MSYFNPLVNDFLLSPSGGRVFFLSFEEVKGILDFYSVQVKIQHINNGLFNEEEIPLFKPFHVVAAENEDSIIFGLSNENVTRGLSTFATASVFMNEEELKTQSNLLLGSKIAHTIKINKGILHKHKTFFYEYSQKIQTRLIETSEIVIPAELSKELDKSFNDFIAQIIKERARLYINPIFKTKDITVDKTLCFAVLPFDDDRLEIFKEIIEPLVKDKFSMQILKANDIFSTNEIMEDIWNYICKSRFIIADISKKNPNVFYELGIAHTVGKEVITICEEGSYEHDYNGRFPFDIAHRRIIKYRNTGVGMKKFEEELSATIDALLSQTSSQQIER